MRIRLGSAILALALAGCGSSGDDGFMPSTAATDVQFTRAFPRLSFASPVFLAAAPGDNARLYVTTQGGELRVLDNTADPAASTSFLDIRDRVTQRGGEEGLLGFAFHPEFAANRQFYVYYSPAGGTVRTRLSRFTADNALATRASTEEILLTIEQPFNNHKGGGLAFGPDGMLYAAIGDGGGGNDPLNNAQSLATVLGKVLRLTAAGAIPADNPFVGTAGARGEIWALGLRNPWRISFDRASGELWAGDVGQSAVEEIDLIVRGGNYGWRALEGTRDNPAVADPPPAGAIPPRFEYTHAGGHCSITGGYVYRGSAFPARRGQYFYADFCSGQVWALRAGGGGFIAEAIGQVPSPTSFGEDATGELYITSLDGGIFRMAAR